VFPFPSRAGFGFLFEFFLLLLIIILTFIIIFFPRCDCTKQFKKKTKCEYPSWKAAGLTNVKPDE